MFIPTHQVLSLEWWTMKDGSPNPSDFPASSYEWTEEVKTRFKQAMDTILRVRGIDPGEKGWCWTDHIDPKKAFGSIGYLDVKDGNNWMAAFHATALRMTFPWLESSSYSELQLNEEEREAVAAGQLINAIALCRSRLWLSYPAAKRMVEGYIQMCKHHGKPLGASIE